MNRARAIAATAILLALTIAMSPAHAGDHRLSEPDPSVPQPLRECTLRNNGRISCHVCVRETFEGIPENHPALKDPHARTDYLRFYRHRQACRRNPSSQECARDPEWSCS